MQQHRCLLILRNKRFQHDRVRSERSAYSPVVWLILSFVLLTGCTTVSEIPDVANDSTLLMQAELAMDSGDLGAALEHINKLLQSNPDDVRGLQMLLSLHTANNNVQGQRASARKLLELRPRHGQSFERLGLLALAGGRLELAADFLEEAVAVDPDRWAAWNGLGVVADAQARYDDAQNYYLRGLQIIPGHPRLIANLGWSNLLSGHVQEAEHLLRESAKNAPNDLTTRSNLAFCVALQGRYQEAVHLYENLYGKSVAANNVGYAALLRDDIEIASHYFKEAMRLEPSFYRRAANNLQQVSSLNLAL